MAINVSSTSEFSLLLQQQLPGAMLAFQDVPGCKGLALLLIQPGYDIRGLTQEQIECLSDDPPYWIFCWASGRAMALALMGGELDVRNKVVVDFGAGSGVVAIAAKLAGARKVYACDIDLTCCQLTALNAHRNQVDINIISNLDDINEPIDLILAADVLYEKQNLQFLDWMLAACPNVVVADSRLKSMPDLRFSHFMTITTTSFPDYGEAKANNEVKFYRAGKESG